MTSPMKKVWLRKKQQPNKKKEYENHSQLNSYKSTQKKLSAFVSLNH